MGHTEHIRVAAHKFTIINILYKESLFAKRDLKVQITLTARTIRYRRINNGT